MAGFTRFEAFSFIPFSYKSYRLDAPLVWDIGAKGSGWALTVPEGTVFDISVPRALEWALNPHDRRVLPAAAVHDELLVRGHDAAFASSEFRRAAIARGCSVWWAWVLFFSTLAWTAFKPKRDV
jgi:hypothetical protein